MTRLHAHLLACSALLVASNAFADAPIVVHAGLALTRHHDPIDVPASWTGYMDVPGRTAPTLQLDVAVKLADATSIGIHTSAASVSGEYASDIRNHYRHVELGVTVLHTARDRFWIAPWAGLRKPFGCERRSSLYTDYMESLGPCDVTSAYGLSAGADLIRSTNGYRLSAFAAHARAGLIGQTYDSLSLGIMLRFEH